MLRSYQTEGSTQDRVGAIAMASALRFVPVVVVVVLFCSLLAHEHEIQHDSILELLLFAFQSLQLGCRQGV